MSFNFILQDFLPVKMGGGRGGNKFFQSQAILYINEIPIEIWESFA